MEEEHPAEAAGRRPAVEIEVCRVKVKIDSPLVAIGMVATGVAVGAATIGAFYHAYPQETEDALKRLFRLFLSEVLGIREGSIVVELSFHSKESFLAFMTAFEAKTVKHRLQEELSKIGFKGELEVTIVNDKEAYGMFNVIR